MLRRFCTSVCVVWIASAASAEPAKPNVVFLLADQWRAQAFGYTGDPNARTPNLDRLAAQSVNFQNTVSVCPVCTPYRASLLTGRYPMTTGMFLNDVYLPAEELCMAEIFKQAGYDTAYIGKWHLDGHGRAAFVTPARRHGFDYWKAAECDHNYPHSHYYEGNSPEKKFWDGYDAVAQTRDAEQYIRQAASRAKPFLLFVSYGVPHFPHGTAPAEDKALFPPESIKMRPNVPPETEAAARREAQGYYAHCTALDRCIGELLKTIVSAGIEKNTVLVFTSDHGEMLGSQGRPPYAKQVPWDESAHVPFLLRYPALQGQEGRRIAAPITTPDILPTLLGLAGVPIPKTIQGEDLSSWIRTGASPADRAALYMNVAPFDNYAGGQEYRALRTARYTYVRGVRGPWLLYDNETDPYQQKNLVGVAGAEAVQKKLDAQLQAELRRVGDDFPTAEEARQRFGYHVSPRGHIPYAAEETTVQSPRRDK